MTTPTISEVQEDIIETFNFLGDWTTRYEHIIDLGKQVEDFPDELRVDKNKLEGCQSQVWIVSEMREGRLYISATSDSAIVRGLIALLLQVYSDREPVEVLTNPPDFVKEINLNEHLSPTRSNGLAAMVSQIMQMAYLEKERIDTR